jgi:Flp pilus assembly protein TadD
MARLLGMHGDVEGSLRNYAAALRRAPDSAQALVAAARDLTAGGYADRALPLAERAAALGPHSPDAHEALGDALLQSGRMAEAIAHYNYTTNYAPSRARAIQARVDRYAAAHPQPVSPAEQAYREASGLIDGQIGLQRTPTRALELAQKASALDPGNLDYLRLLLRLQFGARKMEEAIATAKQIVHAAPSDARTQALLGVMLADKAETPAQFAEVEAYLDAAKNSPAAAPQRHYGTGLLALRRRDGARAVAELTEAARLDPTADVTFYKLAQAQQLCGHSDAAAKALAEYERRQKLNHEEFSLQGDVSQHPNEPAAYLKLAAFYQRNGRTEEAKAMREIARRRFSSDAPSKPGARSTKAAVGPAARTR